MVWRRVLWSIAVVAFLLGVALLLNHTESCNLSDPPQCSTEGPSWTMIALAFAVSLFALIVAAVLKERDRRRSGTPAL
jgi:formate hydrogenlyase subunit 3/multisubunit Na+/H+ antiporter MnhD subunit